MRWTFDFDTRDDLVLIGGGAVIDAQEADTEEGWVRTPIFERISDSSFIRARDPKTNDLLYRTAYGKVEIIAGGYRDYKRYEQLPACFAYSNEEIRRV